MAATTLSYKETVRMECERSIYGMLQHLPDYCKTFDESRAGESIAVRTRKENLRDLSLFFRFLVTLPEFASYETKTVPVKKLETITLIQLDAYTSWLGGVKSDLNMDSLAIKRNMTSIRSFYSYLYSREFIDDISPVFRKKLPKIKRKDPETTIILERSMRPPFFQSYDRAIDEANEKLEKYIEKNGIAQGRIALAPALAVRNRLIVHMLIATGIRVSELCGMDVGDFSSALNCINIIRKGDHPDRVYLSDYVRHLLDDYLENWREQFHPLPEHKNAMFLSEANTRITVRSVERMIKKHADESLGKGNKISPHKLRATFATEYYEQTLDIEGTANAVGHADISTTATYYVRKSKNAKMRATELDFHIDGE